MNLLLFSRVRQFFRRLRARLGFADSPGAGHLRALFDDAGLGVWDWDMLAGDQIVTPTWYEILGYAAGEVDSGYHGWLDLLHPDDLPAVAQATEDHVAGRTPSYAARVRLRARDGSWRWIETRGRIVERGPGGIPMRMVGTHRDIQPVVEAEQQASGRRELLTGLLEWIEVVAWSFAPDFRTLLYASGATQAVYGYPSEAFYREPDFWQQMVLPEDRPAVLEGMQRLQQEGWQEVSYRIRRGDGQVRWVRSRGHLVQDPAGHALRIDGYTTDVTDRLQSQQSLQGRLQAEHAERQAAEALRAAAEAFNRDLVYDHVLDRLLDCLAALVPYDGASVLLVIEGQAHVARVRGYESPGDDLYAALLARTFDIDITPNLRRLAAARKALTIPDTLSDPDWLRFADNTRYRSWAGAPVFLDERLAAILSIDRLEPNAYTPDHLRWLDLYAAQASLALKNATLYGRAVETLDHEHQLAEVSRAISSELDLNAILPAVTRLAAELVGAEAGSMSLLDENDAMLTARYTYNMPLELTELPNEPGQGLAWETVYTRKSILLDDYAAHPKADLRWSTAGVRAMLSAPLLSSGRCLGALGLFNYDPERRFLPGDVELVELVARQAAVAIQNARLYEAAQRRAAEAETLRQAASVVISALDLNEVMDKIFGQLALVVPYDSAAIFLFEEQHLRMRAGAGYKDLASLLALEYPTDNYFFRTIQETNSPLLLSDARSDPRFAAWGQPGGRICGWIGVPLRVRGTIVGFLTIDHHLPNIYRPSDAEMTQAFADEASLAIANARLFEQVQQLAITDPLTGLYNRRYFFEAAHREFERARRYQQELALLLVDIDHFKQVNDTYGHLVGDRVLAVVAARCRQSLREVDVLARYGGEEFIFLLPQTGLEGARLLAERVRELLMAQPVDAGSQKVAVSASMGLAGLDETCADVQELLHRADQALYATKNSGRGRVSVWGKI